MDHTGGQKQPLELWGGIECTVNRVGEVYFDQMERSGHAQRISDLDHIASLGISAIRYPVLWERLAPDGLSQIDWPWSDARLARLRELDIKPIVGLVHHGSGPRHTSLTQPSFAPGLAEFARAVAERYPWVDCYTPVNEPLTTARFSGLYGVWYPHGRDDLTFARAYLNQIRAIILAMREVRHVNPDARLIQTEDLGKTHSTLTLAYQSEFENARRWLTFDLLNGNVNPDHPMWNYLKHIGVTDAELYWFVENTCPPNIIGVNYYVTSERYLDERIHLFPGGSHGGNGWHRYADVEAVRVAAVELAGVRGLLQEVWERYRCPLAITELHLGCTREEQLRWFVDGWEAARSLCAAGVDLRAVTAWSMFGSFDWNCLVTCSNNFYEPGVFDVREGEPRPTALAGLIRDLAVGVDPAHPAIPGTGWWQRRDRWSYPYDHPSLDLSGESSKPGYTTGRCIVVIGDAGMEESAILRLCQARGLPHQMLSRTELTFADLQGTLDHIQPWALVTEFIGCEGSARGGQAWGASLNEGLERIRALGRYCAERQTALLVLSSACESGGAKESLGHDHGLVAQVWPMPVVPDAVEECLLRVMPESLIIRGGARLALLEDHLPAEGTLDTSEHVRPACPLEDVLNAALDLLVDGERGVWNLGPVR